MLIIQFKVQISKFKVPSEDYPDSASDAEEAAEAGGAADIQDSGNLSAGCGARHLPSAGYPSLEDQIQIY